MGLLLNMYTGASSALLLSIISLLPPSALHPALWARRRGRCPRRGAGPQPPAPPVWSLPRAMSLLGTLPAPVNWTAAPEQGAALPADAQQYQKPKRKQPPPYGHRKGFVPRTVDDFGDGGAFPEIHVAQYPNDMGRKREKKSSTLGITVDGSGAVDHSAIVTHGASKGVTTYSRYQDLVPKNPGDEGSMERPDEETIEELKKKTQAAMDKITGGKVDASHVSHVATGKRKEQYLRYTPNVTNTEVGQRIIHMVELPQDPMEPPKFKHKRVPKGPPSPPVPVMHSPPRKVTVKDQQEWKIPPCIRSAPSLPLRSPCFSCSLCLSPLLNISGATFIMARTPPLLRGSGCPPGRRALAPVTADCHRSVSIGLSRSQSLTAAAAAPQ